MHLILSQWTKLGLYHQVMWHVFEKIEYVEGKLAKLSAWLCIKDEGDAALASRARCFTHTRRVVVGQSARLIAIGERVKVPTTGQSDQQWCRPIALTGLVVTHSALNQQVPDISSDFVSPSILPGIFCLISEFYITPVAKYEYNMGNSVPCTNTVSSVITNTCIISCASYLRR